MLHFLFLIRHIICERRNSEVLNLETKITLISETKKRTTHDSPSPIISFAFLTSKTNSSGAFLVEITSGYYSQFVVQDWRKRSGQLSHHLLMPPRTATDPEERRRSWHYSKIKIFRIQFEPTTR